MVVRNALDVDLSVVGKGPLVKVAGTNGTYSLNGSVAAPVLIEPTVFGLRRDCRHPLAVSSSSKTQTVLVVEDEARSPRSSRST